MKKVLSGNKGFSLIELIVVIAILGVLVGVAAPNLFAYIEKSRVASDVATVETFRKAAQAYVAGRPNEATYDAADVTEAVIREHFSDLVTEGEGSNPDTGIDGVPLKSKKASTLGSPAGKVSVEAVDVANGQVKVIPDVEALQAE